MRSCTEKLSHPGRCMARSPQLDDEPVVSEPRIDRALAAEVAARAYAGGGCYCRWMQARMLDVEAVGHGTRLAWLGLALAVTIALAAASTPISTRPGATPPGARGQAPAEDIERLQQELAAQADLDRCMIQLHARCEIDCRRQAERAHRSCPTEEADPAALARKAQMDAHRALLEAEQARRYARRARD